MTKNHMYFIFCIDSNNNKRVNLVEWANSVAVMPRVVN